MTDTKRMAWPKLTRDELHQVDHLAAKLAQLYPWNRWDRRTVIHLAIVQGLASVRDRGILNPGAPAAEPKAAAVISTDDFFGTEQAPPPAPEPVELPPRRPELEGRSWAFDTSDPEE